MQIEFALSIIFMLALTLSNQFHYSTFMCLYTFIVIYTQSYKLYPIAISNTIAVSLTWYFVLIYDKSFAYRMIEKNKWTSTQFLIGDMVLHLMPFIKVLFILFDRKTMHNLRKFTGTMNDLELIHHCGFYSLFMNLVWAIVTQRRMNLDIIYVQFPAQTWNIIWTVNAITHVSSTFLVNYVISSLDNRSLL